MADTSSASSAAADRQNMMAAHNSARIGAAARDGADLGRQPTSTFLAFPSCVFGLRNFRWVNDQAYVVWMKSSPSELQATKTSGGARCLHFKLRARAVAQYMEQDFEVWGDRKAIVHKMMKVA